MGRNGREINQQGASARFLSVLLWLSGHKAISLWRIIMPITTAEKQTVPSLWWHQDEEFATWRLAQRQQVMDDFHLYRGSAETHQKLNPVCLLCVWEGVCVFDPVQHLDWAQGRCWWTCRPVSNPLGLVWRDSITAHKNSYCSLPQSLTCLHVI